jgi:hypothetical protein
MLNLNSSNTTIFCHTRTQFYFELEHVELKPVKYNLVFKMSFFLSNSNAILLRAWTQFYVELKHDYFEYSSNAVSHRIRTPRTQFFCWTRTIHQNWTEIITFSKQLIAELFTWTFFEPNIIMLHLNNNVQIRSKFLCWIWTLLTKFVLTNLKAILFVELEHLEFIRSNTISNSSETATP